LAQVHTGASLPKWVALSSVTFDFVSPNMPSLNDQSQNEPGKRWNAHFTEIRAELTSLMSKLANLQEEVVSSTSRQSTKDSLGMEAFDLAVQSCPVPNLLGNSGRQQTKESQLTQETDSGGVSETRTDSKEPPALSPSLVEEEGVKKKPKTTRKTVSTEDFALGGRRIAGTTRRTTAKRSWGAKKSIVAVTLTSNFATESARSESLCQDGNKSQRNKTGFQRDKTLSGIGKGSPPPTAILASEDDSTSASDQPSKVDLCPGSPLGGYSVTVEAKSSGVGRLLGRLGPKKYSSATYVIDCAEASLPVNQAEFNLALAKSVPQRSSTGSKPGKSVLQWLYNPRRRCV